MTLSKAQTLDVVDFGLYQDIPKLTEFQEIVGADNDGFYVIRSEGFNGIINPEDKLWLEYYGSLTMSQESVNEIILPVIGGEQSNFEKLFYLNKKLILFTSVKNNMEGKINLYVQYLSQTGTVSNKPKKIATVPISNLPSDRFNFLLTENNSKIVIYCHATHKAYNGEPYSFVIIDTNLQVEFSEDFELPLNGKEFEIIKTRVGNSGLIYLLAKVKVDEKKKSNRSNNDDKYTFTMLVYNRDDQLFNTYDITINKYIPCNVSFELNQEENIVIMGFFSAKSTKATGEFIGAFYKIIDPRIQKELPPPDPKSYFTVFDKEFLAENLGGRNGETPDQYNNFIIRDIFITENNSMILLAENYYETTSSFTDPQTKQEKFLYYYNYNDILAIGVNRDGKMAWVTRIPKYQTSLNDFGYYCSYYAYKDINKIRIIFNDISANKDKKKPLEKIKQIKFRPESAPSGSAYLVTLYDDGSFEKDPLFPNKDAKAAIIPKMFYQAGERIITVAIKGKDYKFGGFIFE
ncbi:MAG: hypothetical protein Kow0068_04580 [Marinilabiliales bacterium]